MSPVERRSGHSARALVVAGVGVALALAVALGVSILANRGDVELRLGDDFFEAGEAEDLADEIAENGPILYSDVASRNRDIVIQHQGDDPDDGWLALAARPHGTPRRCAVQWEASDEVFRLLEGGEVTDACDGREFPADGGDLPQYPIALRDDGELYVDLRE